MSKRKITVCILFGGRSGEHEVSLLSAQSIHKALDKNKYNVRLVGIDKKGKWLLGKASTYLLNSKDPSAIKLNTQTLVKTTPEEVRGVDVFFPITHGTYGEDGCLQGMLELTNIAYVGAGVLGSAVGMDKDVMKRLLQAAKIPIAPFIALKRHEATNAALAAAVKKLHLPLFVKPANLGSSVGVTKAHSIVELKEAVDTAFQYDTKILLEQAVVGREVECSVLGNDKPIASVPGEVKPQHEFYDYEAKYIDEHGALLEIPAKLDKRTTKKVQDLAVKVFQVLECSGMARVDFFVKKNGKVLVNEINTLPGFTSISMYPKLWGKSGLTYTKLLDKLIEFAQEKKEQRDKLKRDYSA
ncbi:MAG: D-alanine--D-alanine ligase [Patescibacteria group bacterium]|jgi:D-alanine-D-alanine ligase